MFFIVCAILYIIIGIVYYRQIASIERSFTSYVISIVSVLAGIVFFIGFFMGV